MRNLAAAGLALTFAACGGEGNQIEGLVDGQALEITSGTSFGMCAGYCVTELRIVSGSIELTEESWRMELPARTRTLPLERRTWERLRALADAAGFRELVGVHGCPDCADGGAEWIEIGTAEPLRITFEYGAELDGIEELQKVIRELRSRFDRWDDALAEPLEDPDHQQNQRDDPEQVERGAEREAQGLARDPEE